MERFDYQGALKEGYTPKQIAAFIKERDAQEGLATTYKEQNAPKQNLRPVRSLTPQETSEVQQSVMSVPEQATPFTDNALQTPTQRLTQIESVPASTSVFPGSEAPQAGTQLDVMGITTPQARGTLTAARDTIIKGLQPVPALVAAGLQQSTGGAMRAFGENVFNGGSSSNAYVKKGRELYDEAKVVQDQVNKELPVEDGSAAYHLRNVGVSLGTQVPAMGLGLLTGGAALPLAMMGTQTGTQKYGEYRADGVDPRKALLGALGQGVVEAGTEMLPMMTLFGKGAGPLTKILEKALPAQVKATLGDLSRPAVKFVEYFGEEQLGESTATVLQDAIDIKMNRPEMTWDDIYKDLKDTWIQTAISAPIQAGGVHAARGILSRAAATVSNPAAQGLDPITQGMEFNTSPLPQINPDRAGRVDKLANIMAGETPETAQARLDARTAQPVVEQAPVAAPVQPAAEVVEPVAEAGIPSTEPIQPVTEEPASPLTELQRRKANLEKSIFNADGTQKPAASQRMLDNYAAITSTIEKMDKEQGNELPAVQDANEVAGNDVEVPDVPSNEAGPAAIVTDLTPDQQAFVKGKVEKLGNLDAVRTQYSDQTAPVDRYAVSLAEQMYGKGVTDGQETAVSGAAVSGEATGKKGSAEAVPVETMPSVDGQPGDGMPVVQPADAVAKPLLPMQKGNIKKTVTKLGSMEAVQAKYGARLDDPADLVAQHAKEVATELYPEVKDGLSELQQKSGEGETQVSDLRNSHEAAQVETVTEGPEPEPFIMDARKATQHREAGRSAFQENKGRSVPEYVTPGYEAQWVAGWDSAQAAAGATMTMTATGKDQPETAEPATKAAGLSPIENELAGLDDDAITDLIHATMEEEELQTKEVTKVKKQVTKRAVASGKKAVKDTSTAPAKKRAPSKPLSMVEEAAKEAGQGFADSFKALAAAFGVEEGKLSTFPPHLDHDAYSKARPHFEGAWGHYKESGKSLKEFVQYLVRALGQHIQNFADYMAYFLGEMKGKHSFEKDLAEIKSEKKYKFPDERPVIGEADLKNIVPAEYMDKVAESLKRPETHLINTPEREALRQELADKLYGTGAKNKDFRADLVLGLAASGKSSIAKPLAEQHGSKIIDSDEAKEMLPEFDNGNGANAVHEESSDIFGRAYNRALLAGDNIVLPLVGGSISSLENRLRYLSKNGYEVHLHFVDLAMEKSVLRLLKRYEETGRLMDPQLVTNNGLRPYENLGIVESKGGVSNETLDDQAKRGREADRQPQRPAVRISGVAGLDPGSINEQGRAENTESETPEPTYRVESSIFYDNDVPFGQPGIVVYSKTNPVPRPQQQHVAVQITVRGENDATETSIDGLQGQVEPGGTGRPGGPDGQDPLRQYQNVQPEEQAATAEGWWDGELTREGRAEVLTAIGSKVTPGIKWQYLKAALKEQLTQQWEVSSDNQGNGVNGKGPLENSQSGTVPADGEAGGSGEGSDSGSRVDANGNDNTAEGGNVSRGSVGVEPGVVRADGPGTELPTGSIEDIPTPPSEPRTLKLSGTNPGNYRITDETRLGEGTRGKKIDNNLAAIRLLKTLETENRYPTIEEQHTLARYVGWGGLKSVFDPTSKKPQDIAARKELENLLTKEEYFEARQSVLNAHYTSKEVITSIYDVIRHMGFTGGHVLEPTYGSGNFAGLMPADMADSSKWYGSELDPITSRLGQFLYPDAQFLQSGFQKAEFPYNKFDLVIGNPPFGDERITDNNKKRAEIDRFKIHNYVIAKSGMHLKPGGLMAMVVTSRFLDTANPEARDYLAKHFNFLGAIRLPSDAFAKNAGTEVTTDLVFFQKLMPGETGNTESGWLQAGYPMTNEQGKSVTVNRYFAERPSLMLGVPSMEGTMYGGGKEEFTLTSRPGQDTSALIADILATGELAYKKDILQNANQADAVATTIEMNREDVGVGGYYTENGNIFMRGDDDASGNPTFEKLTSETIWSDKGQVVKSALDFIAAYQTARKSRDEVKMAEAHAGFSVLGKNFDAGKKPAKDKKVPALQDAIEKAIADPQKMAKAVPELEASLKRSMLGAVRLDRIRQMLRLREATYQLISAERFDLPGIEVMRKKLNNLYDNFVNAYGYISSDVNAGLMADDIKIEFGLENGFTKPLSAARAKVLKTTPQPAKAKKAAILKERIFFPTKEITEAANVKDGYGVSLSEKGKLDLDYIGELTGKTVDEVIKELSAEGLIYKDPKSKQWVQEDEYLSGNVKAKHKDVANREGYEKNAAALKEVFPADVPTDKIFADMGATWIPAKVYEEFLETLGVRSPVVYVSKETGRVSVTSNAGVADNELNILLKNDDFSVPELFDTLANKRAVVAYDYHGKDEPRTVNKTRTKELVPKAARLKATFKDWIFADTLRAEDLTKLYNDTQNTHADRTFNGKHLKMVGNSPAVKFRHTQRNAVWRGIQSPVVLLDHCVGSGKTYTIIATVMERKRLGLSRKAGIVVPNHIVGQWARSFMKLYPGARILAATEKDFSAKNRRRLLSRIATGNYDAVIMGHSSFGFIPLEPETEQKFIQEEVAYLERALSEAASAEDKRTVRTLTNRIAKKRERITSLMNKQRDDVITFENMGIDYLVVDESHEFKNLEYSTGMQNVVGMGNPKGAKKSFDAYSKIQYLRGKGGGITFATGTPISNSLVEMYTILRYLNNEGLKGRNIDAFDSWVRNYASVDTRIEYTATQKLKERQIMASFNNLPELLQLYKQFADTVTMNDLKRIYAEQMREQNKENGTNEREEFPVPKVTKGGRQLDVADATPEQKTYMDYLVARAERLEKAGKDNNPKTDNALWIMTDARKMALDIRLVDPNGSDHPDNKIHRAVAFVKRKLDETAKDSGTILVFCDLSTPAKAAGSEAKTFINKALDKLNLKKNDRVKRLLEDMSYQEQWNYLKNKMEVEIESLSQRDDDENNRLQESYEKFLEDIDPADEAVLTTTDSGFSVYDEVKRLLIEQGVPENEVRFIHDAATQEKKKELFDQVNAGQVRVLIGSSKKMGAGTNVQHRVVAEYHMDAPWRPSDVEQREGRVVRQGNELYERDPDNFEVEIVAASTRSTFDAVMWQILSRKQEMLEQFRSGVRSFTEENTDSASYADFMAESTGSPAFKEKFRLEKEISDLESEERNISARRAAAERTTKNAEQAIKAAETEVQRTTEELQGTLNVKEFEYEGKTYPDDLHAADDKYTANYREEFKAYEAAMEEYDKVREAAIRPEADAIAEEVNAGNITYQVGKSQIEAIRKKYDRDHKDEKPKQPEKATIRRLAKESKLAAMAVEIEKTVNALDSGSVVLKLGTAEIELEKATADDETTWQLTINGHSYGSSSAKELGEGFFSKLFDSSEIRRRLKEAQNGAQYSLDSRNRSVKEAELTLAKVKFEHKDQLEKMRARYLAVVEEVNMLEADLADKRATESNRYIDSDRLRFPNGVERADGKPVFRLQSQKQGEIDPHEWLTKLLVKMGRKGVVTDVAKGTDTAYEVTLDKEIAEEFEDAATTRGFRKGYWDDRRPDITTFYYDSKAPQPEADQIRLSKAGTKTPGADAFDVRNTLTVFAANMDNAPKWSVVQSESELPSALVEEINSIDASGLVRGAFLDNQVYIIADNLQNFDEAIPVFLHETVGHYGMRGLLGKKFDPILQQVISTYGKKGLQDIADRYGLDLNNAEERKVAAEEKLAEMAETGEKPGFIKRTIALIKEWLRKMGLKVKWTDGDIKALIGRARGWVERGDKPQGGLFDGERFMVAKGGKYDNLRSMGLEGDRQYVVFGKGSVGKDSITEIPEFKRWFGPWQEWLYANRLSEPDSGIKLINDLFPAQDNSVASLEPVQRLMLGLADNNKVFRGVVSLFPIDVVDSIIGNNRGSHNVGGYSPMLVDALDSPVSNKNLSSLTLPLTDLATKLRTALASGSNHINGTTLLASDFNLPEVVGLLAFERMTDLNSSSRGVMPVRADKGTKSTSSLFNSPLSNTESDAAAFANLLYHHTLLKQGLPAKGIIAPLGSQVKDEQGKPLVVYHGTGSSFDTFNGGSEGIGNHFGSKDQANQVASVRWGDNKQVVPVYLAIKNPIRLMDMGHWDTNEDIIPQLIDNGILDADYQYNGNAQDLLRELGYDGVVYLNRREGSHDPFGPDGVAGEELNAMSDDEVMEMFPEAEDSWIAFTPDQIKSATGNNGNFDGKNPDIRMSLRRTRTGNPDVDAVLDKIGAKEKTMLERIKDSLGNLAHKETRSRELEQGIFDKYASLRYLDKMAGVTRADDSAYIAARMSTSLSDVMLAMLKHGHPVWKDGGSAVQGKGLVEIFKPVAEDLDQFLGWMVGERAQKLMDEGRERYFDQEEINLLKGLKTPENRARWEQARREYILYKRKVLDFAEAAGVINPAARKIWDHEEYVPFYRIVEDKPKGPFKTKGIASQNSGIKTLKGADERLGDIFENIVRNFTHLVDASLKNNATDLAAQKAELIGAATRAPMEWKAVKINNQDLVDKVHEFFGETQEDIDAFVNPEDMEAFTTFFHPAKPQGKDVIHVLRNGKPEYYQVHDELLLRSMASINEQIWGGPAMTAMRYTKRLLTIGITSMPDFMIRNLMRDTVHTWTISRGNFIPVVSSLTGIVKAMRDDPDMIQLMAAGGAFHGGYAYGNDPAAAKLMVEKLLTKRGIDKNTILDTPKKLWQFWQSVGGAVENSARVQTYANDIKAGKSHLEAAFNAKDVMDFSMRGDWAALSFLTQTVPFLGARIQGLQRLGKGMLENPKSFMLKGSLIALAAVLLYLHNRDDEKYQELEEWDKDTYFHFFVKGKHFRLPKPFEVGAIFGTIPERLTELFLEKNHDGKLFAKRMTNVLTQTFAVGLPQILNEPAQQWANKDFFTGRPIVTPQMEGVLPGEQHTARTSATMQELGRLTNMSPVRMEHMVKGYFGTLGMYVLGAADMATRKMMDYPAQPSTRPEDWPVLSAFYKGSGPANNTKFTTSFYDLFNEVNRISKTVDHFRQTGEHAQAEKLIEKEMPKLSSQHQMKSAQKQLSRINKQVKIIHLDRNMTPDQKRAQIDELQARKNEITRLVVEQARENGAR